MKYNPIKFIFILLGFITLGIGMIGIVVPVLPTTPFLLLASFCFAKGSERFHRWFRSTGIYKKYLDGFVKSRSMTLKAKVKILVFASLMLLTALYFTPIIHARIAIACVIVFKYYYFIFRIKTIRNEDDQEETAEINKKILDHGGSVENQDFSHVELELPPKLEDLQKNGGSIEC